MFRPLEAIMSRSGYPKAGEEFLILAVIWFADIGHFKLRPHLTLPTIFYICTLTVTWKNEISVLQ